MIADPSIVFKIQHRAGGGCTLSEVREAFERRRDSEVYMRGGQVAGFGDTFAGRRLFAAFVPVDEEDGIWRLKTAWPL